jgi:hypothetical protein
MNAQRIVLPSSFSAADESYALERAYVPEHIPGLMSCVSNAKPYRLGEYLGFARENWFILVGYPLGGVFSSTDCEGIISQVRKDFAPDYLWFIGPELPESLLNDCQEKASDDYYRLDLQQFLPKGTLRRVVKKAEQSLAVRIESAFTNDHKKLVNEFLKSKKLPPMVAGLYRSMPDYIAHSNSACLLCARDLRGRLSAFFVIEQAARSFDTYVLGCYSRRNYVPYASDLLFSRMVDLTREQGKRFINLGLGVNEGIKRFKQKWGGVPFLKYEFCECYYGLPKTLSIINLWLEENQ